MFVVSLLVRKLISLEVASNLKLELDGYILIVCVYFRLTGIHISL